MPVWKMAVGVALAFGLGFVCRLVSIPAPAPNAFIGAVLVMAVTVGYLSADKMMAKPQPPAITETATPPAASGAQMGEAAAPNRADTSHEG